MNSITQAQKQVAVTLNESLGSTGELRQEIAAVRKGITLYMELPEGARPANINDMILSTVPKGNAAGDQG